MDFQKQRSEYPMSPSFKLSNGFILPEGKLTPNTLFVGGIDLKVEEQEIREFFERFGAVKEVRIITYRGGLCKGYGFVYFNDDVDITMIVEQQISFKGKKLKLGPAIMKERSTRKFYRPGFMPPHLIGPAPSMSPNLCYLCSCCAPVGGGVAPSSPVVNMSSPYIQPYSNVPGVMIPPMPMSYSPAAYTYQQGGFSEAMWWHPDPLDCWEQETFPRVPSFLLPPFHGF